MGQRTPVNSKKPVTMTGTIWQNEKSPQGQNPTSREYENTSGTGSNNNKTYRNSRAN